MDSSAPPLDEIERAAAALGTTGFLIEKDWHVVRILHLLASRSWGDIELIFSGGTSLSKAHRLIQRFSEDVDFRVIQTATEDASRTTLRKRRSTMRDALAADLKQLNYTILDAESRDETRSFQMTLDYTRSASAAPGTRQEILLEVSFHPPELPVIECAVASYVGQNMSIAPEVPRIRCVNPNEIGADKLSAIAWRVVADRIQTKAGSYEPELMRHAHDLAALEARLLAAPEFGPLAERRIIDDLSRGGLEHLVTAEAVLSLLIDALGADERFPGDYENFVANHVFAPEPERIDFNRARSAVTRLATRVSSAGKDPGSAP